MSEQLALLSAEPVQRWPLTEFIIALMKMTPAQRRTACSRKASQRYGLPLEWCQWWIDHMRSAS